MVAMNVVINIQAYVVLVGMTVVIVEMFGKKLQSKLTTTKLHILDVD